MDASGLPPTDPRALLEPVRPDAERPPDRGPAPGVALCLSGGGYRAMLFHVGALWRLSELGVLPTLSRISSVSGGSIVAAFLGLKWRRLGFDSTGVATQFEAEVVTPLRALARRTIDLPAIVAGAILPGSAASWIARAYRQHLFGDATLQDLPGDPPRFVINATSVQSGVLVRFMKPAVRDYRVGELVLPRMSLADVVAASSAFPPVLSPHRIRPEQPLQAMQGSDLSFPPYTAELVLTDGGVYDNLGLETAWKRYQTILVSDGGGRLTVDPQPSQDWGRHGLRAVLTIHDQIVRLRKRQLIASYQQRLRSGAYWAIDSSLTGIPGALPCEPSRVQELATVPVRLARINEVLQERLINWGYASCADAMGRRERGTAPATPARWPYGSVGV